MNFHPQSPSHRMLTVRSSASSVRSIIPSFLLLLLVHSRQALGLDMTKTSSLKHPLSFLSSINPSSANQPINQNPPYFHRSQNRPSSDEWSPFIPIINDNDNIKVKSGPVSKRAAASASGAGAPDSSSTASVMCKPSAEAMKAYGEYVGVSLVSRSSGFSAVVRPLDVDENNLTRTSRTSANKSSESRSNVQIRRRRRFRRHPQRGSLSPSSSKRLGRQTAAADKSTLDCRRPSPRIEDPINERAICPFTWELNYDPNRIPNTIYEARCNCPRKAPGRNYDCKNVLVKVKTLLYTSNSCTEWMLREVVISMGCVSVAPSTINVVDSSVVKSIMTPSNPSRI